MNALVPTVCSIACFAFGKEKSLGRPARGRDATTTRDGTATTGDGGAGDRGGGARARERRGAGARGVQRDAVDGDGDDGDVRGDGGVSRTRRGRVRDVRRGRRGVSGMRWRDEQWEGVRCVRGVRDGVR